MLGVEVAIVRWVDDEPQPGTVECQLIDAHGRLWSFVEKVAIVSEQHLDAQSPYPQSGAIAGEVVGRRCDAAGRALVLLDTQRPWAIESVCGAHRFEVFADSLVEW